MLEESDDVVSAYISHALAALRVMAFVALTIGMVPIHLIHSRLYPDDLFTVPLHFHRLMLKVLGFRVRVHGTMAAKKPVLFVANHSSYLDIPVLGGLLPAAFIAKSEVAEWPIFGVLAKIQNTVFIERRPTRIGEQRKHLNELLAKGRSLILFPEGTSSDGQAVLPFKSALFSLMEDAGHDIGLSIQPVSIACTALDGLPMTRALRPFYSWYGDMTLVKHLWNVFRMGRFTIDVMFHPPVAWENFADRKALSSYCQQKVALGIEQCVTGRGQTTDNRGQKTDSKTTPILRPPSSVV